MVEVLFFPPKPVFLVICGQGNTGMNCSWGDGGLEGDTRVCMFVCACGFLPGGGSGRFFLPPSSGDGSPGAPLAPRCSARNPHARSTGGHAEDHRIPWETAGGTALSPTRVALPCHCRGHLWQRAVTEGDTHGTVLSL